MVVLRVVGNHGSLSHLLRPGFLASCMSVYRRTRNPQRAILGHLGCCDTGLRTRLRYSRYSSEHASKAPCHSLAITLEDSKGKQWNVQKKGTEWSTPDSWTTSDSTDSLISHSQPFSRMLRASDSPGCYAAVVGYTNFRCSERYGSVHHG